MVGHDIFAMQACLGTKKSHLTNVSGAAAAETDKVIRLSPFLWCLTWIKIRMGQGTHYELEIMSMVEPYQHGAQLQI